jgi:hypothetical protein
MCAIGIGGCSTESPANDQASGTPDQPASSAAENDAGNEPDQGAVPAIDNSETQIDFQIQEYGDGQYGDGPVEVPMFSYDGAQPAFDATDHKNPTLEEINLSIREELIDPLNAIPDESDDWMEIRSYPFTSQDYLQVVSTMSVYPNYADDGDVFSWVFHRQTNEWIQAEDVYASAGLTGDALLVAVRDTFKPENEGETVTSVEPAAFMYHIDSAGTIVPVFLLEIVVDNPDSEPWRGLFGYAQVNDEAVLEHFDRGALFDPSEPDETDPPLAYARDSEDNGGPGMMIQLPADAAVDLMEEGVDSLGNPYAQYRDAEGAVSLVIRRAADIATLDAEEIFAQVTAPESESIEQNGTWKLESNDDYTAAYTYPAYVFEYDQGSNEDLTKHVGVYIATDSGGWIVDAGIDADNYDIGYPITEDWLANLQVVDPA